MHFGILSARQQGNLSKSWLAVFRIRSPMQLGDTTKKERKIWSILMMLTVTV